MKYKLFSISCFIAAGLLMASALPSEELTAGKTFSNPSKCLDVCPPPPPTTPPPTTPPPTTPPPTTPPPTTPPPTTPPPTTPPPTTPPATIPPTPICRINPIHNVLLALSCNNCPNPDCSALPNGTTLPYPNHCQFYWICENGRPTICYCPNGCWYDRERRICDLCPAVTNCPANAD